MIAVGELKPLFMAMLMLARCKEKHPVELKFIM